MESMKANVVMPTMANAVTCRPKTTVPSPKIIKENLNIELFYLFEDC